jgi:hypothetical protein
MILRPKGGVACHMDRGPTTHNINAGMNNPTFVVLRHFVSRQVIPVHAMKAHGGMKGGRSFTHS